MKVRIDPKTHTPRYMPEKKDISDVNSIKKMMETRGWKILRKYVEIGRETLIDFGKNGIKSKDSIEQSKERWAILMGYDECIALPDRLVKRVDEFIKEE